MFFSLSSFLALKIVRFPFDSKNLSGYIIAVILQYIILAYELFVVACTISIVNGALWFTISTTIDLKFILKSINRNGKSYARESDLKKFIKLLHELIYMHANVKQLSKTFTEPFFPVESIPI